MWRKYGGLGTVRSSHQTVPDYTLHQWFPSTQQFRFMTACRRLEKLVLPSIFGTRLSSLMMWNLQSYPTTVLNKRMWHFRGQKYALIPPTYFQGVNLQDLRPWRENERVCVCFSARLPTFVDSVQNKVLVRMRYEDANHDDEVRIQTHTQKVKVKDWE